MKTCLIIKNADFSNVKVDDSIIGHIVPMENGTINSNGQPVAASNHIIRSKSLIYVGAHKTIEIYSTNNSAIAVNWYETSEYANRTELESLWSEQPHRINSGNYDYINILSKKSSVYEDTTPFSPNETIIYWKYVD